MVSKTKKERSRKKEEEEKEGTQESKREKQGSLLPFYLAFCCSFFFFLATFLSFFLMLHAHTFRRTQILSLSLVFSLFLVFSFLSPAACLLPPDIVCHLSVSRLPAFQPPVKLLGLHSKALKPPMMSRLVVVILAKARLHSSSLLKLHLSSHNCPHLKVLL